MGLSETGTRMDLTTVDIILLLLVGLVTGVLGGMAGLGGSIIMIPAMSLLFQGRGFDDQHLFQAAAMAVNVAVSIPAARRHFKNGAIRTDLFWGMLPWTLVLMAVGVVVSNLINGRAMERVFAVFVMLVAVQTLGAVVRRAPELDEADARVTPGRSAVIGGTMGFFAGLLGVGGGVIAVPLTRLICRLPIRRCIATSAAVMGVTSIVGAVLKMWTLGEHGQSWKQAAVLSLALAPTALVGGYIGGGLTHTLPLVWVRGVLAALLLAAGGKMLGWW